jgi:(heptosyl)LPS beta-1,4-glucosyltransferase
MKPKPLVHDDAVTDYEFKASVSEAKTTSKQAPTLGVVAICRNEQRDLGGFLAHLLPWVDEIVLVDDGSTDDTLEIARDAGPKVSVVSSPRLPGEYFSHQRNKGIKAARSDWLLHMDIDERVPPELRREIEEAIRRPDVDGLRFHRHNFFLHRPIRGGGWQLHSYLHVARRQKFAFGGKIHEECKLSSPANRVKRLRSFMWHFNEDSYEKRRQKSLFYTRVEAETLLQKNIRVRLWHLTIVPFLVFIKRYFLLLGFRDGIAGWILAFEGMASTFDAYAIAWDQQNRIAREEIESRFDSLAD